MKDTTMVAMFMAIYMTVTLMICIAQSVREHLRWGEGWKYAWTKIKVWSGGLVAVGVGWLMANYSHALPSMEGVTGIITFFVCFVIMGYGMVFAMYPLMACFHDYSS